MQIIIFNKYMDKENKFIEKLDIESTKEFENYKKFFLNNEEDKSLFFNFLFSDLISYEKLNGNTNIEAIFKNPEIIIESKINSIVNKIYEKDYNLLEKIKEKFSKTKTDIKSKLDECINHIEILKKSYIDILIKDFIPINNEIKLIFTNKKVLVLKNLKKDNYSLAERFIRIIFNSIANDEKKAFIMNNNINISSNNINNQNISNYINFYNEDNINIFNDVENKFIDFSDMNNNFRYWIVLIYLISQLFNTNSNYEILFDQNECKTNIEKLCKLIEEKKEKKKHKKKKHKKNGGGKEDYDKSKKINNKKSDKNAKIKNLYNDVFEYCYVYNNKNLKEIYINPFDDNIRKYFKSLLIKNEKKYSNISNNIEHKSKNNRNNSNEYRNNSNEYRNNSNENTNNSNEDRNGNNSNEDRNENNYNENRNNKSGGGSKQLLDPFDKKNIQLKNIIEIKNSENIKNNSKIIDLLSYKKLKYDIYQSLKIYKNEDNLKKLYNFISKIKIKIILLLYSLYKLKKNLYEKYLNKINIIFFNKESRTPKKNNKKSPKKNNNNNSSASNNSNKSNNNKTILNYLSNIDINKRIKNIETEIKLLENEKGTKNYDEKLLKKDEEIKRLYIQKYKNLFFQK
jgi:hypothetical protein